MNTLFYFDLEPVVGRYTEQLSNEWMPFSLTKNCPENWNWVHIKGKEENKEIKVGQVLDACSHSIYSMQQTIEFLNLLRQGKVKDGDVLYFQDFWAPGIESIFYALDMYGIKTRNYAMLHAQSVDEYDFTHKMRSWMRWFELGIDSRMNGIFVGSQIHKEQLRAAGFNAPIYIVSLPFGKRIEEGKKDRSKIKKKNQVLFVSRFDREKNPLFMLQVAKEFLETNEDWEWIVTSGHSEIKSNDNFIKEAIISLAEKNPRFKIETGITKERYYDLLAESKICFNSSLQDYVSWTVIEASTFNCYPVTPNFRSFTEILPEENMYKAFNINSAVETLINFTSIEEEWFENFYNLDYIPILSELGLLIESYIMYNDWKETEFNIWLEKQYIYEKFKHLL